MTLKISQFTEVHNVADHQQWKRDDSVSSSKLNRVLMKWLNTDDSDGSKSDLAYLDEASNHSEARLIMAY